MKAHLIRQVGTCLSLPWYPVKRGAKWAYQLQARESARLYTEMTQVRDLMPLLMKQRNGKRWSSEDKRILKAHLGKLLSLGPYLALFILPGGFFALPVLAWWLDRRRRRRMDEQQSLAK